MDFEKIFKRNKNKFILINIENEDAKKASIFADNVILKKKVEYHHKMDPNSEFKRFFTGCLGELAIEKLLGIHFIDWKIGNSIKFNIADLSCLNLNIGIKTVEYGKFPIIHKKVLRPEIITVKLTDTKVYVCGFASKQVLKKYQNDSLILSPTLKRKGTKTAFFGFDELIPFHDLGELRKISINFDGE
tara:strand:- start:212 stop:775 length:564 start_codon:yes stop_codon:yes gene_type:complete